MFSPRVRVRIHLKAIYWAAHTAPGVVRRNWGGEEGKGNFGYISSMFQ